MPEIGDEVVQFGNVSDKTRQAAIYLQADETGVPCIDILDGIKSKSFTGCLKSRLGCLDGISDPAFIEGISGYGLYCENGYFKGTVAGAGIYMLRPDGSGYLANGNISWDERGNILFSEDVKLNWSKDMDSIKADVSGVKNNLAGITGDVTTIKNDLSTISGDVIGLQGDMVTINGKVGDKLTHIGSDGIYTGTLAADKIVGGKIDASVIDTDALLTNELLTTKLKAVTIETEKLVAKKGSRIGNLTITEKGSLYGAVTTFDNCSAGAFIITGIVKPNENTYVNHVINNIGWVSTYMLYVQH